MFGKTELRVDRGADEFYWPKPDYNRDGIVNFIDFAIFAAPWGEPNSDVNLAGDIDIEMDDLAAFCDAWLWLAPWSDEYQQMMAMGGEGGESQMMLFGEEAAMAEAVETQPLQTDTFTVPEPPPSIEEMIEWLDEMYKSGLLDIPEDEYLAFKKLLEEQLQ